MKQYEIWAEGFKATGQQATATKLGTIQADSFKHACDRFMEANDLNYDYDRKQLTYWGCKLYDNEQQARQSFG